MFFFLNDLPALPILKSGINNYKKLMKSKRKINEDVIIMTFTINYFNSRFLCPF